MNSISSVTSTIDPFQSTNLNAFVQFVNDFNAVGTALQSGNLKSAQDAVAAFQQDLPGGSQSPFGKNSQANTDYNTLTGALQNGDLATAQKAFASLQTDLEEGSKTKRQPQNASFGAESETSNSNESIPTEVDNSLLNALA